MPDNVSFNAIPVDIRTPGQFIEIDNSKALAGLPGQERKLLILGQRLAAGSVAAGMPTHIFDASQAPGYFGRGSQLAAMIAAAKAANPTTDMWAIALDDLPAGVAATSTITVTGVPTGAGLLALYIAGIKVAVSVAAAEANATTASDIAAAINALPDLPVTAAAALGVVTLTASHKGLGGNDLDVRLNYWDGDITPAGLTVVLAAGTAGAGNPDVTAAITALGTDQYYSIVTPWSDAANMSALELALDTRWGPLQQKTGHAFTCYKATLANLTTYGTARNSVHSSVLGVYDLPTPPWVIAAAWGAVIEFNGAIDPARPFQTLLIPGMLAPPVKSRFQRTDRDVLLRDGISTYTVDAGGNCLIERVVTTYQTNASGIPDVSYLDLETKWTVDYIRYAVRARIALRFPRYKLANDGTAFAPGQAIVTPSLIRGELLALFRDLEQAGLVENFDQFKADLLVVRSTADVNRINAVIPPNIVNQFRVLAASVQFRL